MTILRTNGQEMAADWTNPEKHWLGLVTRQVPVAFVLLLRVESGFVKEPTACGFD